VGTLAQGTGGGPICPGTAGSLEKALTINRRYRGCRQIRVTGHQTRGGSRAGPVEVGVAKEKVSRHIGVEVA